MLQAVVPRAAADACALLLLLLLPALRATTRSKELACTLRLHCARAGNQLTRYRPRHYVWQVQRDFRSHQCFDLIVDPCLIGSDH